MHVDTIQEDTQGARDRSDCMCQTGVRVLAYAYDIVILNRLD